MMKQNERAFRHAQKVAINKSSGMYDVAPIGNYYDWCIMKGPKALKRYVSLYKDHLKACHWDDMFVFKMGRCKNWFDRNKVKRDTLKEIKDET